MEQLSVISVDGGSPAYWQDRKSAFGLIRQAELAFAYASDRPYRHGGRDENGDTIAVENVEAFDALEGALLAIEANPTAVSIVVAQAGTRWGRPAFHDSSPRHRVQQLIACRHSHIW